MRRRLAVGALLVPALVSAELRWDVVYTGEQWANASGGLRTASAYLDNLDIKIATDDVFGIDGAEFFAYVLYNNGTEFSADIAGDLQTVSNIDAPEALRLYEFWLGFDVHSDVNLRLGLYDLNSEFDAIDTAALFINSSHGIGPDFSQSGENGPSIFPVTSLAARLRWDIDRQWSVQLGLFDAVPGDPDDVSKTTVRLDDGALGVVELAWQPGASRRVAAGHWRYSRESDPRLPAGRPEQNAGFYLLGEAALYTEGDSAEGLRGFLRYGVAEDAVNVFDSYLGAGLVYRGLLPGRPADRAGIAVARAIAGSPYRRSAALTGPVPERAETVFELTYRFGVAPWLTLQPDIQYTLDPGLDPALDNALSIGLRFEAAIGGASD